MRGPPYAKIYVCRELPDVANALGLDCSLYQSQGIWPIILIAVACAILCKGG